MLSSRLWNRDALRPSNRSGALFRIRSIRAAWYTHTLDDWRSDITLRVLDRPQLVAQDSHAVAGFSSVDSEAEGFVSARSALRHHVFDGTTQFAK